MRAHLLKLWGPVWWLPVLPFLLYAAVVLALGDLRPEHVLVVGVAAGAAYGNEKTRRFFVAALPFLVLGLLYDALRYLPAARPERVLGCSLREAELAVFGVGEGAARMTPNDFFVRHHHPAVDLFCALPYGAYIFVMIGHWAYLYRKDREVAKRFGYVALATHVLGFATYVLLPAAPPWYVRAHGCEIDLAAKGSAAALGRVDAMLGIDYFAGLYSRGARVFGALPSLHVAYPLYGLLTTWRRSGWLARGVQVFYALSMMFAAIYLDHHYVFDVLLGATYATLSFLAVSLAFGLERRKRDRMLEVAERGGA